MFLLVLLLIAVLNRKNLDFHAWLRLPGSWVACAVAVLVAACLDVLVTISRKLGTMITEGKNVAPHGRNQPADITAPVSAGQSPLRIR